jgi:hypothetical protein
MSLVFLLGQTVREVAIATKKLEMHRQTEKSCNTAEQKYIERGTGAAAL